MKCEYCGKNQKSLHACSLTSLKLCDTCYSITLNPYIQSVEKVEEKVQLKTLKEIFK